MTGSRQKGADTKVQAEVPVALTFCTLSVVLYLFMVLMSLYFSSRNILGTMK